MQVFRSAILLKRDFSQVCNYEIFEIFKNTYFEEYLRTTASAVSSLCLYVHYLRHRFINQKQNLKTGFIFLEKSNIKTVWYRKKKFQLIHIRKSQFFIFAFLQKMLIFWLEHSFKGRTFCGTNVWVWQIQNLRVPSNLLSWLDLHWELQRIYIRNGQIWKVAKGNHEKINDIKSTPFLF